MKKNFFKKLSFVLALAMIVSVVAPAASAFAAEDLSLNSTKKYLHLGRVESGENDFNFNINGTKQKGWKYEWTSQDEEVAVVNESNGVTTATGVGSTKVTCVIYDKDGEEVLDKPLVATVTVRDNIKTVKITNIPEIALAVDELNNFNRDFVTEASSTKKTSSVTRWVVDKADKAVIDDSGIFKASEAGEYKITANSFQSKAKYEAWKVSGDAELVLATETITVKVAAGIVSTKQTKLAKFEVTFDSDMSKADLTKDTAKVYQMVNGKAVETGTEKIKELTLDSTGKVATVEMYVSLRQEADYRFKFGDLEDEFKSAKVDINNVDRVAFADFDVDILGAGVDMNTKVSGLDANGVEIYPAAASSDLTSKLAFTYGGENTKGYQNGDQLYLYIEGYSAPVTVKFENWVYNETTKVYEKVTLEDAAVATAVKANNDLNTASMQYAVAKGGVPAADSTTWAAPKSVPATDGGFTIYTRYKLNSDAADAAYKVAGSPNLVFTYESTNTDKLLIAGNTFYPVAQGTVTVLVKNTNNETVGSFDIVIASARSYTVQVVDKNFATVGNHATLAETATATVTSKDSMNERIPSSEVTVGAWSFDRTPSGVVTLPNVVVTEVIGGDNDGNVTIAVTGNSAGVSATEGAYVVKVPVTAYGTTRDVFVTVQVIDAVRNATVVSWKVELSATSVDLKENMDQDVAVGVYGYNSSNVRVDQLTTAEYDLSVVKGSTAQANFTDDTISVVVGVTGQAVVAYSADTYLVTATVTGAGVGHPINRVNGSFIGAAQLAVANTTKLERAVVTTVVAPGQIVDMVKAAFDFKLNDAAITEANIVKVNYSKGQGALVDATPADAAATVINGESAFINTVTYKVTYSNGAYVEHTFNVGVSIKAQN